MKRIGPQLTEQQREGIYWALDEIRKASREIASGQYDTPRLIEYRASLQDYVRKTREAAHVAETVDELRRDCEHRWVMIRPSRPGPDGWAKRCTLCGAYVDISAEARAEAAAEYDERATARPGAGEE